jgi:myotubularin-related protein 5/13
LYKRGALLKAWKQRWFQLDTIKHQVTDRRDMYSSNPAPQLLYYDSREDQFVRAAIDLGEIKNVTQPASIPPGGPKKLDEQCFFALHTSQRTYSLCAETRQEALDWQDKIQSCL